MQRVVVVVEVYVFVSVCACFCERARVCVCSCERECVYECVCVCVCVCAREGRVSVAAADRRLTIGAGCIANDALVVAVSDRHLLAEPGVDADHGIVDVAHQIREGVICTTIPQDKQVVKRWLMPSPSARGFQRHCPVSRCSSV